MRYVKAEIWNGCQCSNAKAYSIDAVRTPCRSCSAKSRRTPGARTQFLLDKTETSHDLLILSQELNYRKPRPFAAAGPFGF